MRTLLSQAWDSVTELDGKWLKSFALLIRRPGQLTVDFCLGIRKNRLTPFQLLVFCNILFFLVVGLIGYSAFTTRLEVHTQATNFLHQPLAQQLVTERLADSGEAHDAFATRFNDRAEIQAKSLVIIMVPMLALVVFLLNAQAKIGAVAHWVFATHVFAFMLLLQATVAPLLERLLIGLLSLAGEQTLGDWFEFSYSVLLFLAFGLYYHQASKRFHQWPAVSLIIKSLLFVVAVYWVFLIYRMVLFFTTFYTL